MAATKLEYLLLDLNSHTFEQGFDLSWSLAGEHDGPLTGAQAVLAPPPGCSTGSRAAGAEHVATVSDVQSGPELASASTANVAVNPLRSHPHSTLERSLIKLETELGLDLT